MRVAAHHDVDAFDRLRERNVFLVALVREGHDHAGALRLETLDRRSGSLERGEIGDAAAAPGLLAFLFVGQAEDPDHHPVDAAKHFACELLGGHVGKGAASHNVGRERRKGGGLEGLGEFALAEVEFVIADRRGIPAEAIGHRSDECGPAQTKKERPLEAVAGVKRNGVRVKRFLARERRLQASVASEAAFVVIAGRAFLGDARGIAVGVVGVQNRERAGGRPQSSRCQKCGNKRAAQRFVKALDHVISRLTIGLPLVQYGSVRREA